MLARPLLAMIAMLPWSAVPCLAAGLEVGVYLRTDGGAPAPVLQAMETELKATLGRAGFRLKWWHGPSSRPIEAEELIVVDLRGGCQIPQAPSAHHLSSLQLELASTSVVGTEILPFSSLDCNTFNSLIAGSVSRLSAHQREQVYGRALGRVLAHEFYHVLAKTHKHTAKGVAKRAHSAEDLTAEHFDFDTNALTQLRQVAFASKNQTGPDSALEAPAEPASLTLTDAVSGRQ
jgi:hypothetical protein